MNAIEYARRNVHFWQSSPISGQFDDSRYPLVRRPLLSLSDIRINTNVFYGPTQSIKTVLLEIAIAYWLDVMRKSVLAVAQTDDDAKEFSLVKLKPFLERIPTLKETVKKGTHSISNFLWQWASHELIVSGPGPSAQQSKSAPYLVTDEAHCWCVMYPGAMASLDNRMGLRYDRCGLHGTTAADAGTEIDIAYHKGQQNEWHVRCIHCNGLFQPLWLEPAREIYNGARIFIWEDSQSETETLDSIRMACPFCDKLILDTPRNRADMDEGADYKAANPTADVTFQSFRWNAFAPRWKKHRELLSIYLSAMHKVSLGDVKPYEDWVKKQEVRTWTGEFPMRGDSVQGRDYDMAETSIEVIDENKTRTCSIDRQEGQGGKGFHLWALCEEWERGGMRSRRIDYKELSTWSEAIEFQNYYNAPSRNTASDFGHQVGRDVFAICGAQRWLAMKSGDSEEFPHQIRRRGLPNTVMMLPYSEARLENPLSGKHGPNPGRFRPGTVPPGFCLSILWSKPIIYGLIYALKGDLTGRYYGIARDFPKVFIDQLHSYIPQTVFDKVTNTHKKEIWLKIKEMDHGFVCAAQGLVLAIRAGFYPLAKLDEESK